MLYVSKLVMMTALVEGADAAKVGAWNCQMVLYRLPSLESSLLALFWESETFPGKTLRKTSCLLESVQSKASAMMQARVCQ